MRLEIRVPATDGEYLEIYDRVEEIGGFRRLLPQAAGRDEFPNWAREWSWFYGVWIERVDMKPTRTFCGYVCLTSVRDGRGVLHVGALRWVPAKVRRKAWEVFNHAVLCGLSEVCAYIPVTRPGLFRLAMQYGFKHLETTDTYHGIRQRPKETRRPG